MSISQQEIDFYSSTKNSRNVKKNEKNMQRSIPTQYKKKLVDSHINNSLGE